MVGHKVRAQLFKSFMHTTKHAALLIRQETESSNVVTVDSSALTAFEPSPDKAWTSPMNGRSWHIDEDRFWTRISLSGVSVLSSHPVYYYDLKLYRKPVTSALEQLQEKNAFNSPLSFSIDRETLLSFFGKR